MARKDRDYWGWFRQVLFFRNTAARFCDVAALLPAVALSLASAVANAEVRPGANENARAEAAAAPAAAEGKVELLARVSYAKLSVAMMGVGIEGAYARSPHYGFGVELGAFVVDNGADPHYSDPGTLHRGYHGLAFVEGDLLSGIVIPYVRLGVGLGNYERYEDYAVYQEETPAHINFVGQISAGVALRSPVVARLSAAPTLYGSTFVVVYSLGLGARF
jgi:hypothetical protein